MTHFQRALLLAPLFLAADADLGEAISQMNKDIGITFGGAEIGIIEDDTEGLVEYVQKDLVARGNPRRASDSDFEAMIR